uniref:Uncharacterized protein n=1 Tax=Moniliophthora roreri TaxID=221103 RepID=A0A0W0F6D8_MONRR
MTSHPSTNAVKPDTPPASSPRQPYLDIMNALGDQPGYTMESMPSERHRSHQRVQGVCRSMPSPPVWHLNVMVTNGYYSLSNLPILGAYSLAQDSHSLHYVVSSVSALMLCGLATATRLKNLPYHGHRYISGDVSSVPHLLARPRLDSASAQFEAADADLMKDASRKPGCIVPLGFLTAVLAALGPDTYLN